MVKNLYPQEDPQPLDIFDRNCILILDEDPNYLEYLAENFRQQNFEVFSHTCGELGFKRAKQSIPDCIIVNSDLIDIDGIDLCRKIVDDSITCGIPVIAMGSPSDHGMVSSAKAAGSQFFVAKPVDPRVMVHLVNEAIAEARSWILD